MRNILISFLSIFIFVNAQSQSPQLKELWKLYEKENYDELIEKGEEFLIKDTNQVEFNFWIGRAYYKKELLEESIPYFEKAAKHDDPHSSIKARAELYLGLAYYLKGELEISRQSFLEGRKIKTYSRYTESNEYWYERLGFDDFYSNWSTYETDHFRFYFQDTTDINHTRFIDDCEKAYANIDTFFNSTLHKKIDYFVWASRIDAKNVLKRNLSFTDSYLCYIHGGNNESEGHEIAHDISLNYKKIEKKERFISEGTASYFDQTNLEREDYFKELLKHVKRKKVSVKDVWLNWSDFNSDFSYNLGGLFIGELIKQYGREKFLEFFTDQSYKNAKLVFGKGFDDFIEEFEAKLNS